MLEIKNTTKQKFCHRKARRITAGVLNFYKLPQAEVSLVVVGDQKMKTLNRDFHGQNKTTDVLSFPADKKIPSIPRRLKNTLQSDESFSFDNYLGEIFINIQEAARVHKYQFLFAEQARDESCSKSKTHIKSKTNLQSKPRFQPKSRSKAKSYIFYFLLIHGLLHLIGYQDKTEKKRQAMIALGEKFMKKWYN
ncbi:MAG: rRNA maturation RNase YbeY [Patescibacteria group bacterium]|jgi:rRNA maturation RNase YbeY|nr:rRNA maturation RNase YbeY [bacterium]HQC50114.1 rRNA maturation RNase YbeY [bacterium]